MDNQSTVFWPGGWPPEQWEKCCGKLNPFRKDSKEEKSIVTQEECRKIIDQFLIDNNESYECSVDVNGSYRGEESTLLCYVSSYLLVVSNEGVTVYFYTHPKECLDKCPTISREAVSCEGEFFLCLEPENVDGIQDTYHAAKTRVDKWLAGEELDNEYGRYIRPNEKTLNFLYALVAYYYGLMKKGANK